MSNINYKLYAFEDKTSDEVLLINGFQHINQLIPHVNKIQQENKQLKEKYIAIEKERKTFLEHLDNVEQQRDLYKEVIEEVRKTLKLERKTALSLNQAYTVSVIDSVLQILDKGESNESTNPRN